MIQTQLMRKKYQSYDKNHWKEHRIDKMTTTQKPEKKPVLFCLWCLNHPRHPRWTPHQIISTEVPVSPSITGHNFFLVFLTKSRSSLDFRPTALITSFSAFLAPRLWRSRWRVEKERPSVEVDPVYVCSLDAEKTDYCSNWLQMFKVDSQKHYS